MVNTQNENRLKISVEDCFSIVFGKIFFIELFIGECEFQVKLDFEFSDIFTTNIYGKQLSESSA